MRICIILTYSWTIVGIVRAVLGYRKGINCSRNSLLLDEGIPCCRTMDHYRPPARPMSRIQAMIQQVWPSLIWWDRVHQLTLWRSAPVFWQVQQTGNPRRWLFKRHVFTCKHEVYIISPLQWAHLSTGDYSISCRCIARRLTILDAKTMGESRNQY